MRERRPFLPGNPSRIFWWSFLLTFAVYVYTLAPSIVLRDSGELITAAAHLGVPHPPGYPLLTILSWLFTKIPIGNMAWRVNLLNATCGAASIGVFSLIVYLTGHLMFRNVFRERAMDAVREDRLMALSSVAASLILAFSQVMWSQSVVAEKYALNTLCLGLILLFLLYWIMDPRRLRWLHLSLFIFGLGLTAHQTLLFLFPPVFAAVFLASTPFLRKARMIFCGARLFRGWGRRMMLLAGAFFQSALIHDGLFKRFLVFSILFFNSVFTVLAVLSDDLLLLDTCLRLHFLGDILLGVVVFFSPTLRHRAVLALPCLCVALAYLLFAMVSPFDPVLTGRRCESVLHFLFVDPIGAKSACLLTVMVLMLLGCAIPGFDRAHHNRFIISSFAVTWAGLSLYAYLYFSSLTNPPMNWGYASTRQGFYHSISRGQYSNNLPSSIKKVMAPILLVPPAQAAPGAVQPWNQKVAAAGQELRGFAGKLGLFAGDLAANFTFCNAVLIVMTLFYLRRPRRAGFIWVVFIFCSFVFLSLALTYMMAEANDRSSRWITRVFFLPSHYVYAMFIGYGLMSVCFLLSAWRWRLAARILCVFLAGMVAWRNWALSEQRGHDFGWRYGYDMLKDCGKDAIFLGGTDPGRFVPTYMIFVESRQNGRWKLDRSVPPEKRFDRSDLYIITQNALADETYMKYLRGHYGEKRPVNYNWFERLLGRDRIYPAKPIWLPGPDDFSEAFSAYIQQTGDKRPRIGSDGRVIIEGMEAVFGVNAILSQMIWQKNKDQHEFYVEESYPLQWMYPYLTPFGLCLKLNKEPVVRFTDEMLASDRAYWERYTRSLMSDPRFLRDEDARKAFSKLRLSIAGIYFWHGVKDMDPRCMAEADHAFRQSLELCPYNWEAAGRYVEMLHRQERCQDALAVLSAFAKEDPLNRIVSDVASRVRLAQEAVENRRKIEQLAQANPKDASLQFHLLQTYEKQGRRDLYEKFAPGVLLFKDLPVNARQEIAVSYLRMGMLAESVAVFRHIVKQDPGRADVWYQAALIHRALKQDSECLAALAEAVRRNSQFGAQAAAAPEFNDIRMLPRFQQIVSGQGGSRPR